MDQHTESNIEHDAKAGMADRMMAAVFLAFILLFALAGPLLPDRRFSPQENRYLTLPPPFSIQRLRNAQYMDAFAEYISDQFPARDWWVSFKALCQYMSGQKENHDVYFAGDGYLIGKPQHAPANVMEKNLAAVTALRDAGYDTALLAVPMAAEILRDKLPLWAYAPQHHDMSVMLRDEAPDVFVDIESSLRLAAKQSQVFFRTDHHWTTAGAYTAYEQYMLWLGLTPAALEDYIQNTVSTDFYGALWSKNSCPGIQPDSITTFNLREEESPEARNYRVEYFDGSAVWQTSSVYQPEFLEQKDKYAFFLGQNQPLVVIRTDKPSAGVPDSSQELSRKLLIFKDSYAHCFAPFLLPHFDEIHLADLRYWKQDPIAYMREQGITQVLFLYSADSFISDRSISQVGAYLARHNP